MLVVHDHKYVDQKGLAEMLAVKRLAGVTLPHAGEMTLKSKADVTRNPKRGYQWPHTTRRTIVLQKLKKKNQIPLCQTFPFGHEDISFKFSNVLFSIVQWKYTYIVLVVLLVVPHFLLRNVMTERFILLCNICGVFRAECYVTGPASSMGCIGD